MKVSIVVPIYKVEKYLRQCVESLLAQSLDDIEIILVDDGSPDKCGEIIDEYAARDSRIVAVHQKNAGYSAAVNRGIKMARGRYIGIIESDDFVDSKMYEILYNTARKLHADVVKCAFYIYNSQAKEPKKIYTNPGKVNLNLAPDGAFKIEQWPAMIAYHASVWAGIYEARFIKKIRFENTAGASYQDLPFTVEVLTEATRIAVVKTPLVYWRNEPDQGHSTTARGEKLLLMAKNSRRALQILQESGKFEQLKEAFFAGIFWTNINFFRNIETRLKPKYYAELRELFANMDENCRLVYFREEDVSAVKAIRNNSGWMALYLCFIIGGIRRRLRRKNQA